MTTTSPQEADPTHRMPFLDEVDSDTRAILATYLTEERILAGTVLMPQGQSNNRLWFIVSGTVRIDRAVPGARAETLATLPSPSVFGTTTFFRPETPASASILADSDLHLWTLDRTAQDRLRRDDPRAAEALATAIIRILSERFDLLDRRLAGLMAEKASDRANTRAAASELSAFRTRLFEETGL